MCSAKAPKPPPKPPTTPEEPELQLEDTERRKKRAQGESAEGVGRQSLRIDLNFAGPATGLRLPTGPGPSGSGA
jgi:hypothetical protein